ncbi:MAG: sensor histidine kinase, partial [Sciscionella sp.]
DGLIVADGDGVVTYVNPAARRILEPRRRRDGPDWVGRPLSTVLTLTDLDGQDWITRERPYDGPSARQVLTESAWHTPRGHEVLVAAALHRDRPGGKVTLLAVSLRDARGREAVDRERSDLVATVAHELRSPLTGVKGFTQTLLQKWDHLTDDQRLLMLRTVDADADRLTRLIAELLDVARIDSRRLTIQPEFVDLDEAIRTQLHPVAAATPRPINVIKHVNPRIWVDRGKLSQIVANLVENALKHGDGTVLVTIVEEPDGAQVIVDDEGRGIDPEIRPRVFTKFWRHGAASGSGLGMYIVGGLVSAHHGTVSVQDSPTGGARLRVWLPVGTPPGLS